MIVFVNGPFGVGKTTVARLLAEKIPHAMLYDPEKIGAVLHKVLGPFHRVEDFQDYALWRILLLGGARVLKKVSARTLVVPMTVWRRDLFDTITVGLQRVDELSCFRLTASRDILVDRISSDSEDPEAYRWRMAHVEVCLRAALDPALGTEIGTDGRTPAEVADQILNNLTVPAR
jgi:hypothetical protein